MSSPFSAEHFKSSSHRAVVLYFRCHDSLKIFFRCYIFFIGSPRYSQHNQVRLFCVLELNFIHSIVIILILAKEENTMKTAIVYCSVHHGNTKKLLDAIASENQVDLIDVTQNTDVDLNVYDRIGFAFGIYYSKFHKTLIKLAEEKMPQNKKPFFVYTCGAEKKDITRPLRMR